MFGDSTTAGVGAQRHRDALAGLLASAVAQQTGRAVSWRAVARSGATSRTARDLVPRLVRGEWRPNVVVVLIGVNDLKNLRPLRDWDHDVRAMLAAIDKMTGKAPWAMQRGGTSVSAESGVLRHFLALKSPKR